MTASRLSTSMNTTAPRDWRVTSRSAGLSFALPRVSSITCTPSFSRPMKPRWSPSGTSKSTVKPAFVKKSRVGSTRSTKSTGVAREIFMPRSSGDRTLAGGAHQLRVLAEHAARVTRLRRLEGLLAACELVLLDIELQQQLVRIDRDGV